MGIAAGTKLGPYEILSAIGAGGMGEVYRARDPKLGRDVAIKVLPEAFARDAERMARFQREAKVLASLDHPNIASIYGLEDSGGTRALVMQLVEGPTLADRIKAGPIPVDEAVRIAKQIADALEYAHERGIIHRDLKPANIKVAADDAVKVLDFGLAKALETDPSSIDISTSPTISRMATQAGVLLGTAAYMSPEQAKAKSVDRRADIWAFGCVLYEMLTGRQAFTGETVTDTLASIIKEEPDWKLLPATTPMRVRVLEQRCLQKDPKQRLRDIGDARISLDEVLAGAPDPSFAGAAQISAPIWRRVLPWGLAALFFAIAASVSFIYFREVRTEQRLVRFQIPPPEKSAFQSFHLSPDGRFLTFIAGGRLWIRALDSLQAQPLPGTEGASEEFWSPDSQYVAFSSQGKLKKIAASGGPAQDLCEVPNVFTGGTWNRDGVIVFAQIPSGLFRVSEAGGVPVQLAKAGATGDLYIAPEFLPDGRRFLYTIVYSGKAEETGIYVGSLDGQPGVRLLPDITNASYVAAFSAGIGSPGRRGYLVFERGGTLMAQPFDLVQLSLTGAVLPVVEGVATRLGGFFSLSNNGTLAYLSGGGSASTQLVWKDRAGKSTGTFGPPGDYNNFRLAPDEKRIVFDSQQSGTQAIWVLDSVRGVTSRLTFDPALNNIPMWSPDGLRIVWASLRSGSGYDLYVKSANGTGQEELLVKVGTPHGWASDWSRDGRYLLYERRGENTATELWIAPQLPEGASDDRKPFPYLQTQFEEQEGKFSPDGRWVAYVSNESGRNEIYVQSFPRSGAKFQISTGGGTEAQWRKDGKELFYLATDQMLMAVPVKLGRPPAEPFEAGSPKPLFAIPLSVRLNIGRDYAVSNDGQRFLVVSVEGSGEAPPLTVVQNWQAGLQK